MQTYRNLESKYRTVETLPATAMTVKDYCLQRGCTNPYIYQLVRENKADFEIVLFKGINFIIPLTKH